MKKLLFILNPRAGKTKSRAPLFDALQIYSEAGYLIAIRATKGSNDAAAIAETEGADYDLVVCHGGDGTLHEVVNGLMRLPKDRRPPVSYLPGGSTNDFAASLAIPIDLDAAAQSAMASRPRALDVGMFNTDYFVYVASFGAFTRVAYSVPQDVKNVFGHFAYILEGVRDLETLRPYRMKLTADGETFDGEYLFGAVSNSTSIAGLMKLSPEDVAFDDGEFELLLVPTPQNVTELQATAMAILNQEYDKGEGLIFRHVKRVVAETAEDIPWTLDGEFAPGAPKIDISICDNAVDMLL